MYAAINWKTETHGDREGEEGTGGGSSQPGSLAAGVLHHMGKNKTAFTGRGFGNKRKTNVVGLKSG